MAQSHAPVFFRELPDRTRFRGPDNRMYLKLNGVCVPILLTSEGGMIGAGMTFAWNPAWDAQIAFMPLSTQEVNQLRHRTATPLSLVVALVRSLLSLLR